MRQTWCKKTTALLSLLFLVVICFGSWFTSMKNGAPGGFAALVSKKENFDLNISPSERALSIESGGINGMLHTSNNDDHHDDGINGPVNNLLFLEAPPPKKKSTGLGHNFLQFNHFVTFALENNLAIRTTYTARGHGLSNDKVLKYFFGTQTMAAVPDNCRRKKVKFESLPGLITQAKTEGKCVVFKIGVLPQDSRGLGDNMPYYRRLFENNDNARRSVIERTVEPGVIRVSVHIRRGDLDHWLRKKKGDAHQTELRLVEYSAYTSVLNQLFRKLSELEKHKVRIDVRLYCEGMEPPASIPKATDWTMVDIREEITYNQMMQNVTILPGSDDALQAFDDICFSDIFVTGASGFSYLASILCHTPVILAVPFWLPYEYIPNAIKLDAERGPLQNAPSVRARKVKLVQDASFDDQRFELLWRERFPSQ